MAAAVLLLGCSEILDIPDDPYWVPPEAAALDQSSSSGGANLDIGPPPPPSAPGDAGAMTTPFEPSPAAATDDGGMIFSVPADAAGRPPDNEVTSMGGAPGSPVCPPLTRPSISDFSVAPGGSPSALAFGADAAFPGGTYFYPGGGSLTSSVTEGDWHLSGTVDTVSGFGLYSSGCQPMDASAFPGVAFTLWGNLEGDRRLVFFIETAAQQVSSLWTNANETNPDDPDVPPNSGRCAPVTSRYDGTCLAPRVVLEVTSEPTTVEVRWEDFVGGSPVPSVDPGEITVISWALPQPGDTPYAFDIHIDDLRFMAP
jgi:hypothetical protein